MDLCPKLLPLVLLTLTLLFVSADTAFPQTDLQRLGLRGPVRSVSVETTNFAKKEGQSTEGPRQPSEQMYFTLMGMILETYKKDSSERYDYIYYPNGKLAERTNFSDQFNLTVTSAYIFAYEKGKVIKYFMTARFGQLLSREIFSFGADDKLVSIENACFSRSLCFKRPPVFITYFKRDDKGHIIEEAIFDAAGKPFKNGNSVHRYVTNYLDDTTKEVLAFSLDNNLIGKSRYRFDNEGFLLESTEFYKKAESGQELLPTRRYVYSGRDPQGNWTECHTFNISTNKGKTIEEPTQNTYRTISYF